jgi:hypothetical protein
MMGVAAITALVMVMVLLSARAAHPHHDDIPDPPPQSTTNRLATVANIDRTGITVSGLSSGGFFAHQFHIAYSKLVNGSGILAGGPFACVEGIPNPFFVFWPLDRVSADYCLHELRWRPVFLASTFRAKSGKLGRVHQRRMAATCDRRSG